MIFRTLITPGFWIMRKMKLMGKVLLLAVVCLTPLLIVLSQYALSSSAKDGSMLAWLCGIALFLGGYLLLAFYQSLAQDLRVATHALNQLVQGDLRLNLSTTGGDEFAALVSATAQMGTTVSAMVANVRSNAAFVAHSGQSLAAANRDLSDRTEQQAANLEQTAASVEELASTVQGTAQTVLQVNNRAGSVRDVADQGVATMAEAIASVGAIQSSAKRMDEIVGVIDGLAFQTNILALNAAVEAARAGESGRGFAVVASEVRSLAQRSAESAKEIRQLIGASSAQVSLSVSKIQTAGDSMTQIVAGIRDVATNMSHISTSSAEQSNGLSEITTAVRQLDEITQRNAQMVEHAVTQSRNLEVRATTLVEAFAMFRLQQGSADEAIELVALAAAQRRRSGSRESFLRDITDPSQAFHDRDMYVFVLDSNGTYLAFAGNRAKVGTRVQDIAGIDGQGLVDDIIHQAHIEPGWVEYDITNPVTGRIQTKMSFVQLVDDVYLGCGVYKNLVVS